MTEKIRGKFYPLQNSEWVECCKSLTKSQLSVLYYLRSIDPYSNGITVKSSHLAEKLGITKRAVNAAISVLVEKSYLDKSYLPDQIDSIEEQVRAALLKEVGGQTEVITAVGRIDLLTSSEVIEIKNINDWKEALGKILAYSAFFPSHNKRIHLFGRPDLTKLALAQATCTEFSVTVTFEEVR
ncbi:MarR family transcriptional regulator [Aetokthonos hydrillicola Thurmond2011]|jgi:predicted regulator of amino acid metabolism with ACT domain|uniref:MarR family transcriptional regulator n=1 Tax=Aetokthonos hydrillicola Thurmond2011 TaxID=2712845 RepID=A0AAP5IGU2_9CYAN|nr:helix-turn-helix domain-containing protein [Aetokthonos hydrillicola]MDR9900489.1 MarR family transcriptional regulator [Aetokthonos hydrillicola Thurmond2011]